MGEHITDMMVLKRIQQSTEFHTLADSCIRKAYPCNVYPLEPHFYIANLGYAGAHLFFLFLLQNIDCGYSLALEPPRRWFYRVYTLYVLSKNKKNYQNFSDENFQFLKPKKISVYCMGKFS